MVMFWLCLLILPSFFFAGFLTVNRKKLNFCLILFVPSIFSIRARKEHLEAFYCRGSDSDSAGIAPKLTFFIFVLRVGSFLMLHTCVIP